MVCAWREYRRSGKDELVLPQHKEVFRREADQGLALVQTVGLRDLLWGQTFRNGDAIVSCSLTVLATKF